MPHRSDALTDQAIREAAAAILARPEYAEHRQPDSQAWLSIVRTVLSWLEGLSRLYTESPLLYWALIVGLGLILALLIFHIVWSISRALRSSPSELVVETRDELDFATEAARLAQRGEYLDAAHQLLLASLAHAARAHVFELRAADSNRDVCRKLRQSAIAPPLRERLIELIQSTEALWFGARTHSVELYASWQEAYAELRRSAAE